MKLFLSLAGQSVGCVCAVGGVRGWWCSDLCVWGWAVWPLDPAQQLEEVWPAGLGDGMEEEHKPHFLKHHQGSVRGIAFHPRVSSH